MFQDWMREPFVAIVEEASGHKVRAFFSQVSPSPEMALELFLLERDALDASGDGVAAHAPPR